MKEELMNGKQIQVMKDENFYYLTIYSTEEKVEMTLSKKEMELISEDFRNLGLLMLVQRKINDSKPSKEAMLWRSILNYD